MTQRCYACAKPRDPQYEKCSKCGRDFVPETPKRQFEREAVELRTRLRGLMLSEPLSKLVN